MRSGDVQTFGTGPNRTGQVRPSVTDQSPNVSEVNIKLTSSILIQIDHRLLNTGQNSSISVKVDDGIWSTRQTSSTLVQIDNRLITTGQHESISVKVGDGLLA